MKISIIPGCDVESTGIEKYNVLDNFKFEVVQLNYQAFNHIEKPDPLRQQAEEFLHNLGAQSHNHIDVNLVHSHGALVLLAACKLAPELVKRSFSNKKTFMFEPYDAVSYLANYLKIDSATFADRRNLAKVVATSIIEKSHIEPKFKKESEAYKYLSFVTPDSITYEVATMSLDEVNDLFAEVGLVRSENLQIAFAKYGYGENSYQMFSKSSVNPEDALVIENTGHGGGFNLSLLDGKPTEEADLIKYEKAMTGIKEIVSNINSFMERKPKPANRKFRPA